MATILHIDVGVAQTAAPIASSGLNTQVNVPSTPPAGATQYDITGGTRVGTNLFHSFSDFSVPNNHIANFLNDTGLTTSNILSRVTGGNVSTIFGSIQTTGFENANLFLMNPAGMVFGPNAWLNVGGSVTFTTADYLRFNDNGRFNVMPNPTADRLFSTAPVTAYGFLGSNPGAIAVQGSQLSVSGGQEISLIGGNITIQNGTLLNGTVQPARLSAPNGQVNMATTLVPGEFSQDLTAQPNINGSLFRSYGAAHIAAGSMVDFSQTGNGRIAIRGGQLTLEIQHAVLDTLPTSPVPPNQDTILLSPGSSIVSQTFAVDSGPDIQLVADRLQLIGDADPRSQIGTGIPVEIFARTNGSGHAGNITLRTSGNLELINYVQLDSSSGLTSDGKAPSPILAPGNSGNVDLASTHGNIRMTGFATWATSQTGNSSGKTGTVTAFTPEGNTILDGANIFTRISPQSGGGEVKVAAQNLLMNNGLLATDNRSPLRAGNITVALTDKLLMTKQSSIIAGSLSSFDTQAGDIHLTAKEVVVTQGSFVNNGTFTSGPGGHLTIVTDVLQITGGGRLDNGSSGARDLAIGLDPDQIPKGITPSGVGGTITITGPGTPTHSVLIDGVGSTISSNSEGTGAGAGGSIRIGANSVTLQNNGTLSATTSGTDPSAQGGSIAVIATDQVMLTNGASITASSIVDPKAPNSGVAKAGNISINAGQQLVMRDGSSIKTTTESTQANGGNIDIRAIELIRLVNNSEITTSVKGAEGSGGNIFIDPKVILLQGSNVTAQAVGGTGGNITFVTPLFLADATSIVSASSQRGVSGTVTIQSPTSNLSGAVGQLVSKVSQPQVLLQNRCAALVGGRESTFVLVGRHTLPPEPGDWLSPSASIEHWTGESPEHASGLMVHSHGSSRPSPLARDKDKTTVVSLRRLTPLGFLVRTFAAEPTGCPS